MQRLLEGFAKHRDGWISEKPLQAGVGMPITDRWMCSVSVTAALEGGEILAFARGESTALEGRSLGRPPEWSARVEDLLEALQELCAKFCMQN
jgi:hypothetical protein